MAENGLKNQRVIGVAFDGTGLGPDDKIWGAEFLLCDYKNFKRRAHLKEIPLIGGERAILEPVKLTLAWFFDSGINPQTGIDKNKRRILKNIYRLGLNSPLASSMGRLFDAAASLILGKYKADFEAQLAIELEKLGSRYISIATPYKFKLIKNKNEYILDPLPMFKQILLDLKARQPKQKIAYRFHLTVAEMINRTCALLRKENKVNRVVLSGGVFQNNLLLSQALDLLYKEGFEVFTHQDTTTNDSGISLGQAVIANFRSKKCV
jgi:hydrogenase maturation protein HypF